MAKSIIERQQLHEAVDNLPDVALAELASFLDYLRYKSRHQQEPTTDSSSFLLAIAGLGDSGQQNGSERDEEILQNEIDPVYGWSLQASNSA